MTGLPRYIAIDRMLGRVAGASVQEIAHALGVTPRHARRLLERFREVFGAVWELQILEVDQGWSKPRYRYRQRGASAFTELSRRVSA